MTRELAKVYEPHDVEKRWYAEWIEKGYFHAAATSDKKPYSIVIPPPNVTGALHMGHALNNTLQDILCRWKRMQGYNVLWMPGTDHAGIATQNVVERQLAAEGKDRHDLGREAFIERVWKWRGESGGQIIGQLKRLGASCDWERERFTMDEGLSKAVRTVFVKLYEDGLIYRDNRLINWCPRCHTALSDIEVEHEDHKGHLWHIKYPVVGEPGRFVTVATTRPETMLGDTAVAVHPDDERYSNLVGKKVILPLLGREIPVVADDYVDREFGTGVVKITPAHDFNDFEVGLRHGLEKINVLDESGVINAAGLQYEGLDRFEARKRIVADLEAGDYLDKIEDHAMSVGGCYRCKTVVEPYLSLQWYVKVAPLAERALDAVKSGKTRILPKQWENTYYDWMENIRDWCISRQIWWGHRIPAWFCEHCGEITVAMETPTKCSKCGSDDLRQETDVLDTWFSSALWPFSTMGWPNCTPELKTFYPTSCLITGFDILFFWVARMMMMGLHFMDEVPFKDVYIHALVRDAQGHKMSKSKGNVIDPLTTIEQYGTDAFRFTLAAFAAQGRDIKLAEERIAGYRNFCNKVWNAARFTLMNLEGFNPDGLSLSRLELSQSDKWILHRLNETARSVDETLTGYRYNESAMALYQFTWSEFCDWYLELSKQDIYNGTPERKLATQYVLWYTLENLLRLLHPFMPFITEEIWQALPKNTGDRGQGAGDRGQGAGDRGQGTGDRGQGARGKGQVESAASIMLAAYPEYRDDCCFTDDANEMELVMGVISAIRNIRGEMEVPPSKQIAAILSCGNEGSKKLMRHNESAIISLARLSDLAIGVAIEKPEDASIQVAGDVQIYVPLKGLVDVAAEEERLLKEIGKIEKDIEMFSRKLESPAFVDRAPAEIVAKERQKLIDVTAKKEVLQESLKKIRGLK